MHVAERYLGVRYVWGGESPTGFDCSGLVQFAYNAIGISIPRTTYEQYRIGEPVSRDELEPGDLLFFDHVGHVGMYVGGGRFIHAPHTGHGGAVWDAQWVVCGALCGGAARYALNVRA